MKVQLKRGRRLGVLLPLIMTSLQLGLLAASLIVQREPWVLPVPPVNHVESQAECGENCVVFSPPQEPKVGRIVGLAVLFNFPAIFLGSILDAIAGLFRVPTGEPSLLGFSAMFVPVVWYRIGRWFDNQSIPGNKSTKARVKSIRTAVARDLVWCLFATLLLSLLIERHHHRGATTFMAAIAVLWAGAYLAVGLWGDHRRSAWL